MNPLYKIIATQVSRMSGPIFPGNNFGFKPSPGVLHHFDAVKKSLKKDLNPHIKILKKNTSSFINSMESKLISALKILCSPNLSPKDIEANIKKLSKYFTKLLLKSNNAVVRDAVQKTFSLVPKEIQAQVMEQFCTALAEPKNIQYLNATVLESFNFCNKMSGNSCVLNLPESKNPEEVVRLTESDVLSCKRKYESVSGQKFLTLYHGLERVDYQSFKTDFEQKIANISLLKKYPEIQHKLVSFLSDLFNGNKSCVEKKLVEYVEAFLKAGGITPNTKMVTELSTKLREIMKDEHEKQNALSTLLSNFNLPLPIETATIDGKHYRLGKEFIFDNGVKLFYVMDDAEIGIGGQGIVKKAVMKFPEEYPELIVVKKVEWGTAILEREFEVGCRMAKLGIGPKVFFRSKDREAKLHTRTPDGQHTQNGSAGLKYIMGMQLMDGDFVSLYDHSFAEKMKYSSSILEKVRLLHVQDSVHGDFKLENCLYKDAGTAYLSDFAGVQKSSSVTLSTLLSFTPEYMPAEVLFGGMPVTKHVDVFSVAINLARFLSGKDIADFSEEEIHLAQTVWRRQSVSPQEVNSAVISVQTKHENYIRNLVIRELPKEKLDKFKALLLEVARNSKMTIDQFITKFESLGLAIPS